MLKTGFSLIELTVVLFIIALLASLAFPSYQQFIVKSRRADGHTALLRLAVQMEIYYSQHNSYVGATLATGKSTDLSDSSQSAEHWYQLNIRSQTENSYLLEAIAINQQANEDKKCQIMSLNQLGEFGGSCPSLQLS